MTIYFVERTFSHFKLHFKSMFVRCLFVHLGNLELTFLLNCIAVWATYSVANNRVYFYKDVDEKKVGECCT